MGDLFASFMDEAAVEARGATPLADDLAAIEALADAADLAALVGRLSRDGLAGGAVESYVNTDDRTPTSTSSTSSRPGWACPTSPTTATTPSPRSAPPTWPT